MDLVVCEGSGTDCSYTSTGTSDDDDLSFGGQSWISRFDGWVEITVHALGELEWRGEHVDIECLFHHFAV